MEHQSTTNLAIVITSFRFIPYASRCGRFQKEEEEEGAKESHKAKEKHYEDYAWRDLCEDPTKPEKLRVPELNKYLKHHRLDKHLKSTKNDGVKEITRHRLRQMNPPICYTATNKIERNWDEAENEPLLDSDNDDSDVQRRQVKAKAAVTRRMKMITLTLVIETNRVMSVLPSSMTKMKEEVERPAKTRSERAIPRRSETDFSFIFSTNSGRAGTFLFC